MSRVNSDVRPEVLAAPEARRCRASSSLRCQNNDLLVPNIGFVRDNKGQDSIAGSPANWVGWAAIDGVNRTLRGKPQVDEGIGWQTRDRDGPLPKKTTSYDGNIDAERNPKQDYKAHYKKIWSGS